MPATGSYSRNMLRSVLLVLVASFSLEGADFSGAAALKLTEQAVAFGQRTAGTPANAKLRAFIHASLAKTGAAVTDDQFTAKTPAGPLAMTNIIAKFPGKSGRSIAITGHFDTKKMQGFVGANDGGSSTGFLLEFAAALVGRPHQDDIYLAFFDGEEAFGEWSETDSVYGSRHLAEKWAADGTLRSMKALINVDMIGDKDLHLVWEENSHAGLRKLVWDTADGLGYSDAFPRRGGPVGDDHMPFLQQGVRALDLIDFDYGPNNAYWHTPQDTMDKLGAQSFEIVGKVLLRAVTALEEWK